MSDELNLPWKVYFFGSDGKYNKDEVITIYDKKVETMKNILPSIKIWNLNKLEVRICDSLDYCIMHWKDGKRIFP